MAASRGHAAPRATSPSRTTTGLRLMKPQSASSPSLGRQLPPRLSSPAPGPRILQQSPHGPAIGRWAQQRSPPSFASGRPIKVQSPATSFAAFARPLDRRGAGFGESGRQTIVRASTPPSGPHVGWRLPPVRRHQARISHACIDPSHRRLCSVDVHGRVLLWDFKAGSVIKQLCAHSSAIRRVAWSGGGSRLAVGDDHGRIVLWHNLWKRSLKEISILSVLRRHVGEISALLWHPHDGDHVSDGVRLWSAGRDARILLWDLSNEDPDYFEPIAELRGHSSMVLSLSLSAEEVDGKRQASMLLSSGEDEQVFLWKINADRGGEPSEILRIVNDQRGHVDIVRAVLWLPLPKRRFATVGDDARILLWDLTDEQPGFELCGSVQDNGKPQRWATRTQRLVDQFAEITCVAMATGPELPCDEEEAEDGGDEQEDADTAEPRFGLRLATAHADGILQIWNICGRQIKDFYPIVELHGHKSAINYLYWSPDGSRIITCGDDNRILVWKCPSNDDEHWLKWRYYSFHLEIGAAARAVRLKQPEIVPGSRPPEASDNESSNEDGDEGEESEEESSEGRRAKGDDYSDSADSGTSPGKKVVGREKGKGVRFDHRDSGSSVGSDD